MPINIASMLKQGYSRSIKRNGLILMGIIFAISVLNDVLGLGVDRWVARQQFTPNGIQGWASRCSS